MSLDEAILDRIRRLPVKLEKVLRFADAMEERRATKALVRRQCAGD